MQDDMDWLNNLVTAYKDSAVTDEKYAEMFTSVSAEVDELLNQ